VVFLIGGEIVLLVLSEDIEGDDAEVREPFEAAKLLVGSSPM
jgi:hypothetical protein